MARQRWRTSRETTLFHLIGSSRSPPLGSNVSGIICQTHLDLILRHFCSFDLSLETEKKTEKKREDGEV